MFRKIQTQFTDDNGTNTPLLLPETGAFMHVVLSLDNTCDIKVLFSNDLFIDIEAVTFPLNPHTLRHEFFGLANNHTFANKVNQVVSSVDNLLDHRQAWIDLYTFCECLETE